MQRGIRTRLWRVVPGMALVMVAVPAGAQTRGLMPADFYKEVTVEDVAMRPQGDMVAFTVMTIVEKENKRHREIWLQPLAEGRATGGEAFHIEGVSADPVWSPDGTWIAYVKAPIRDKDGDGEADTPDERAGWVAPDSVTRTLDPKRFDGRVITSMRDKSNGTLTWVPHYSSKDVPQIFVVPAAGGTPVQVTRLAFAPSQVEWTPDGETVLFTADEQQDNEHNRDVTSDLYAVARAGGEPRRLTSNPGGERAAAVSPRADRLAFQYQAEQGGEVDILIVDLAPDASVRGTPRNLTASWDRVPGAPRWTADGRAIRFDAESSGNAHVFEVAVDGRADVRAITTGDRSVRGASDSRDGAWMAYTVDTPLSPPEAFVASGSASGEQQLTRVNAAWLSGVTLQPAERLTWKVADGTQVEGWLVKPVGYVTGRSYPMVLKIHGGPHTQYGNTWFRTFHVLSASGFFVLYPNPRGSSGYGHAFTYATRGKWGELDTEDYVNRRAVAAGRPTRAHPQLVRPLAQREEGVQLVGPALRLVGPALRAGRLVAFLIAAPVLALAQPVAPASAPAARQTQADDYTSYELLAPERQQFRILYDVTATTAGARVFLNPIRQGSEASDERVLDLATGQPLAFRVVTGGEARTLGLPDATADAQYLRIDLARAVPPGGEQRIRIDKTYKDPASYTRDGSDIVFRRSLGIRRNKVVLPAGYELASADRCRTTAKSCSSASRRSRRDRLRDGESPRRVPTRRATVRSTACWCGGGASGAPAMWWSCPRAGT